MPRASRQPTSSEEDEQVETARLLLNRSQSDPVWWAETVFGVKMWEKQKEIMRALWKGDVAVLSCHGAGKTFTAALCATTFLYTHRQSKVITTAPTFLQVKRLLWAAIRNLHSKAKLPLGGECLTTSLNLDEEWFALGLSVDDPDSFQGHHAPDLLVINDEASGVGRDIWEAQQGLLSGARASRLSIGNPTDPQSRFKQECDDPEVHRIQISAWDTPNFTTFGITEEDLEDDTWEQKQGDVPLPYPGLVTPRWAARRFRTWGKDSPMFIARVKGMFPQLSANSLFPLAWIEAAQRRSYNPGPTDVNRIVVDVARYGNNETVIGHRLGYRIRILEKYKAISTEETAHNALHFLRELGASSAAVDGSGVGGGVVDKLMAKEVSVLDCIGSAKPVDTERFGNARAEWHWIVRELMDPRLDPVLDLDDDEELAAQMSMLTYRVNPKDGKIWITGKDDLVEELSERGVSTSPDRSDMVVMAFAPAVDSAADLSGARFSGDRVDAHGMGVG